MSWKSVEMNDFSFFSFLSFILFFRMLKIVAYVEIFCTNLKEEKTKENVMF